MFRKSIKVTAYAMTAMLGFASLGIDAKAAELPSGGVDLSISTDYSATNTEKDSTSSASSVNANSLYANVSSNSYINANSYLYGSVSESADSNLTAMKTAAFNVGATITEEEKDPEEELFKNLVIAQVHNYVNVRSLPSEEGEILGKLYDDSVGTFLGEEDGWYKIKSGSVTGYVKAEFCVTGEKAIELAKKVGKRIATVNTTTLKVRKEPSLDASVIGLVPLEEDLLVIDEEDAWVKVDVEEGYGWVSKEYVDLHTEFIKAESKAEEEKRLAKEEEERRKAREAAEAKNKSKKSSTTKSGNTQTYSVSGGSDMGNKVAEFALQFQGNPYVYGGSSLTEGADCSGFVMSVYENFGVSLPHSSAADREQGYAVSDLGAAQPGDLICYSGHVALYIGNGQIVHASNEETGIIVSKADYREILAIRRIF